METTEIYLLSTKRAYITSITVEYEGADAPDVEPETPVVTVNGQSYGNDAEIEVVKGDMVSVVSANATEMIVNGESVAVSGGTYEFAAETSDIYTFQGKNGEKTSEEVTVLLDVDDLGWRVVVGGEMSDALFDMTKPNELTPSIDEPATSKGVELNETVLTAGDVAVSFTDGTTPTRIWNNKTLGIDLRIYSGGTMTIAGLELTQIVFVENDSKFALNASVGTLSGKTWTAPEGEAVNEVVFTATGTTQIKTMQVTCRSIETLVKAPEFYVNDVLLDAAGDYMKGIEVEAGAVIKAVGHERTHVHYYVEGEDAAAANVKALMAVNADELPWNVNEGAQKHVFEYIVPDAQSQDITIYAKAAKEGYKSQVTQMVLSADRVATGIEAVESGEGEGAAEYFNLQGQRVMNPANGLFIKKAAGKVTKVVL
ncbi:MAG: hypothetical protein K2K36_03250 [Muribaculaceae bacterium]|nr:hypothetical protein [Muribaculaceae bacterium]